MSAKNRIGFVSLWAGGLAAVLLLLQPQFAQESSALSITPSSLSFSAVQGGAVPAAQYVDVRASRSISFTVSWSVAGGVSNWLTVTPSGQLRTDQQLTVKVNQSGLQAGTYNGNVSIQTRRSTYSVPVTLVVSAAVIQPPSSGAGFKVIGWNDLGMHCFDGRDYSIFGVLPPYNTIHAHLLDASGNLITSPTGYTISYQSVADPVTKLMNTTSAPKTNFWQYAAALFFGQLAPDMGLKGFAMPGPANTPRTMAFNTTDNTWMAEGIPITPYSDAAAAPYPTNYFPMMRLVAKNSSGTVVGSTDVVLPTSDEMTCSVCHSSSSGYVAAQPAAGWVNNSDPAKDVKLNILRKHDDRMKNTSLFQTAATQFGYSTAGLEATVSSKPVLCATCHSSNALGTAGVLGVAPLTTAVHGLHANAFEPGTQQTLDSGTTRTTCYHCHPGPKTQCVRGAMSGSSIQCQSCHGNLSNLAVTTRKGWLDEPNCQSCHTGTAVQNSGQIVYTSVFSSGNIVRSVTNQTFATNQATPMPGVSLYRYSAGHGGLQCEACHGSTHAEFATTVANDNIQSTNLQGHSGMLAECMACHNPVPSTVTGGPHGLHPIGSTWVSGHQHAAESGTAACQACHGSDYRGTILSKTQADRTMAGHSFPKGTVIGCYSCHNGPNPG